MTEFTFSMINFLSSWTIYHLDQALFALQILAFTSHFLQVFLHTSPVCYCWWHRREGRGAGRGWFFLRDRSVSVQSLLGWVCMTHSFLLLFNSAMIYVAKNIMPCSLLTRPGIPHERAGQGDTPSLRHFWRVDLFDDPCYVNTQALQSMHSYAGNQSSALPQGSPWHLGSKCLPTTCIYFLVCGNKPPPTSQSLCTLCLRTAPDSTSYEGRVTKPSCWQH